MSLFNKKYCSHCGAPNPRENHTCAKCGKPISSALRSTEPDEQVVVVKKHSATKAIRYIYEGEEGDFSGEIIIPSSNDVVIERPVKLTVGSLKNGVQIPNFESNDLLPSDIKISSRSRFGQEKLD